MTAPASAPPPPPPPPPALAEQHLLELVRGLEAILDWHARRRIEAARSGHP